MKDMRWARKICKYMYTKSLNTKWTMITRKMRARCIETRGEVNFGAVKEQ